MAIFKKHCTDWCHICGKRRLGVDIWYPENAEHDTKNTKYIRICDACSLKALTEAATTPDWALKDAHDDTLITVKYGEPYGAIKFKDALGQIRKPRKPMTLLGFMLRSYGVKIVGVERTYRGADECLTVHIVNSPNEEFCSHNKDRLKRN